MMIELLRSQLEAANATNLQLRLTVEQMSSSMKSMELTISDLRATIANLESLLQERDSSLGKARNQMRGMSKLIGRKSEKQQPEAVAAMTAEEKAADVEAARDMSGSLQLCTLDLCTSSMTTVHAARTSSSGN